jgi:hypothetical protein
MFFRVFPKLRIGQSVIAAQLGKAVRFDSSSPASAAANFCQNSGDCKIEVNPQAQSTEAQAIGSKEVHDFYERMPYPAPLTSLDEHRDLYSNPTTSKPRDPGCGLRDVAGGQVCTSRTACPDYSNRHQRDEPKPYK